MRPHHENRPATPSSAPSALRLDGVSFRYDARPDLPVLTDVSLTVAPGRTVGLIGENGSGKSTLLRLLAGASRPDQGLVEAPASLGVLAQTPGHQDDDASVSDLLARAAAPLRSLERRIESLAAQMAPLHRMSRRLCPSSGTTPWPRLSTAASGTSTPGSTPSWTASAWALCLATAVSALSPEVSADAWISRRRCCTPRTP